MSLKKKPLSSNSYMRYASMGSQMIVIIGLGVWGGIKLDGWAQFKFPLFTILLSMISIGVAIYFSVKDLLKKN